MPKSQVLRPLSEERITGNRNKHSREEIAASAEASLQPTPRAYQIPLSNLKPWAQQPRQEIDVESLRELAASIATSGVLEPLVVRRDPEQPGDYIVIAGHRRLAASQIVAGAENPQERARVVTLPTIVRDVDEATAYALSLVENLQRKDLSSKELLDAVVQLHDVYDWNGAKIARETGRNQSYVNRLIKVGHTERLYQLVVAQRLSPTAAGHLVRLSSEGQHAVITWLEEDRDREITVDDTLRFIANEGARRDAMADPIPILERLGGDVTLTTHSHSESIAVQSAVISPSIAPRPMGSDLTDYATPDRDSASDQEVHVITDSTIDPLVAASLPWKETQTTTPSATEGRSIAHAPSVISPQLVPLPNGEDARTVTVTEHQRRLTASGEGVRVEDVSVDRLARDIIVFVQERPRLGTGQRERLLAACAELGLLIGRDDVMRRMDEARRT